MKRPAHEYAFGTDHDPKAENPADPAESAMAMVAWLADNFHYSSYNQAQSIARDVIDILRPLLRSSTYNQKGKP